MSSLVFDEGAHPRDSAGKFTEKAKADPGQLGLADRRALIRRVEQLNELAPKKVAHHGATMGVSRDRVLRLNAPPGLMPELQILVEGNVAGSRPVSEVYHHTNRYHLLISGIPDAPPVTLDPRTEEPYEEWEYTFGEVEYDTRLADEDVDRAVRFVRSMATGHDGLAHTLDETMLREISDEDAALVAEDLVKPCAGSTVGEMIAQHGVEFDSWDPECATIPGLHHKSVDLSEPTRRLYGQEPPVYLGLEIVDPWAANLGGEEPPF